MAVWCPVPFLLLLLLLLLPVPSRPIPLPEASLADLELVGSEVITDSSDCSAPCGVGLRTQTLCLRGEERTVPEGEDKVGLTCHAPLGCNVVFASV